MKRIILLLIVFVLGAVQQISFANDSSLVKTNVSDTAFQALLNKSISDAERYFTKLDFSQNENEVSYMFLYLLNKQFKRSVRLPSLSLLVSKNAVYKDNHWVLYGKYFAERTKFPTVTTKIIDSVFGKRIHEIDYRTFWCMHCNFFPFTDTAMLYKILHTKIAEGEYELTHAALQLQAVIDNKYCGTDKKIIDSLHQKSINEMIKYCTFIFPSAEITQRDILFEHMAFLAYMKQYDAIPKAYVDFVIDKQNSDGGWKFNENHKASNSHTSILAYWFLLEMRAHYAQTEK